jgi:hypothetical protein
MRNKNYHGLCEDQIRFEKISKLLWSNLFFENECLETPLRLRLFEGLNSSE